MRNSETEFDFMRGAGIRGSERHYRKENDNRIILTTIGEIDLIKRLLPELQSREGYCSFSVDTTGGKTTGAFSAPPEAVNKATRLLSASGFRRESLPPHR